MDSYTKEPVTYCQVFNESKKKSCISDTAGQFLIQSSIGDTLAFLSMSYLGKIFIVRTINRSIPTIIELVPRYYEIDELEFSVPGTYKQFQDNFLKTGTTKDNIIKELPEYNPYITPKLLDTNNIYSTSFRIFHPVSGFYYKHNKTEKSKRKVRQLQEQQLKQPIVDVKYNEKLLAILTGFKGDTVKNFMLFCNFSFNYLYQASQLEIIEEIYRKKQLYIEYCYGKCIPVIVPKRNRKHRR